MFNKLLVIQNQLDSFKNFRTNKFYSSFYSIHFSQKHFPCIRALFYYTRMTLNSIIRKIKKKKSTKRISKPGKINLHQFAQSHTIVGEDNNANENNTQINLTYNFIFDIRRMRRCMLYSL